MDAGGQEAGAPPDAEAAVPAILAKILVVDDHAPTLYALQRTLEDAGVEIFTARNGEQALKHVLEHEFALILMDARMPGMDGYETATLIRNREKSRRIPIIFLTAVDKEDVHMFRGYSAGAVDYVFKPVEPLILRSKVNVFVELFRKSEEIRREEQHKRRLEAENFRVRSEMARAEHALRLSEERQSLIINALPVALYSTPFTDPYSGPASFSERIEDITGFSADAFEGPGDFWISRIHPDDRAVVLRDVAKVHSQGSFATDYRWQCADGSYRFFYDRAVVVPDHAGRPSEIFGMWLDVTEHRQLTEQLMQSQKMEAVGRLTGGIAHDFNNMLTAVLGNLDLLARSLGRENKAAQRVEMALKSALRCADLTQRLLYFARKEPLYRGPVDVAATVAGMAEILNQTLDDSIAIEMRMPPELWTAVADASQLESSLLNLVINARDALAEGGKVIIEAANVAFDEPCDAGAFEAGAGEYVRLSVTDDGSGMPPEVLEHLFEPFFTTKEPGQGTGLGLSIIYTFVQECGGFIRVDSEVGRGTTVSLFLKRVAEREEERAADEPAEPHPRARGDEVVLVAEDDVEVLEATVEILSGLGYGVLQAETAASALDILRSGERVDLLFTDVAMPGGMSGPQLALTARERHPALRVLYTSGYAERAQDDGAPGVPAQLLRKPYRDHQLAAAVRKALDLETPLAARTEVNSADGRALG